MAEEILNLRERKISFQQIAEDLNMSVERVEQHWGNFIHNLKERLADNCSSKLPIENTFTSLPQTNLPSLAQGEMKAKLVSPSKLALFWCPSELPKKLFQHYYNISFDNLVHVIRIYDVTLIEFNGQNAHHFYEIAIPFKQGYWFVKGLFSNRSYMAEVGVKLNGNKFFPLFRSNSVQTPKLPKTNHFTFYQNMIQIKQHEERAPKWRDHVSTYSYYTNSPALVRQND